MDRSPEHSPYKFSGKPFYCVRCKASAQLNMCAHVDDEDCAIPGIDMAGVAHRAYNDFMLGNDMASTSKKMARPRKCVLESEETAMARRAMWLIDQQFNPDFNRVP